MMGCRRSTLLPRTLRVPETRSWLSDQGFRKRACRLVFRILYHLIAALARLAMRSGRAKDLEIVLRHQLAVLGRNVDRPAVTDDDRSLLATVASALPRPTRTRRASIPRGRSSLGHVQALRMRDTGDRLARERPAQTTTTAFSAPTGTLRPHPTGQRNSALPAPHRHHQIELMVLACHGTF